MPAARKCLEDAHEAAVLRRRVAAGGGVTAREDGQGISVRGLSFGVDAQSST